MQMSENVSYFFKIFDFEFLNCVGLHPRLSMKNAVQIVDILAKLYMNDLILARGAGSPMMTLIHRFIDTDPMIEFLPRFAKIALAAILTFKRKATRKVTSSKMLSPTAYGAHNKKVKGSEIVDEKKISEAHMKLVVLLLEKIMQLHNEDVNSEFIGYIAQTQIKIRGLYGSYDPLLTALLAIKGDPDTIMADYQPPDPPLQAIEYEKTKSAGGDKSAREHIRGIYIYIYIYSNLRFSRRTSSD